MATASQARSRLEIAPEDIAAYRRDGAVLVRGVLSPAELRLLETGLDTAHANPSAMFSRYAGLGGKGQTMVDQFPSLGSAPLRQLMEEGPMAELAARMMGTPSAQLVLDQMFYKHAGQIVSTPWHQDTPFLRVRGHDMARVWLSCDPSPAGVTLEVVRGSHLWNVVYDTGGDASSEISTGEEGEGFTYMGIGDERLPPVPDIEAHRGSFDIISWDVEPGDAVVFHGGILHGASGRSDHLHPRRAFASMWGGPKLRYQGEMTHAMPVPGRMAGDGPDIPHNAPIGDYPEIFPVFWLEG